MYLNSQPPNITTQMMIEQQTIYNMNNLYGTRAMLNSQSQNGYNNGLFTAVDYFVQRKMHMKRKTVHLKLKRPGCIQIK